MKALTKENTPQRSSRAAANRVDSEEQPIQAKTIAPPRSVYGTNTHSYALAPPIAQRKPSAGKIETQRDLLSSANKESLQRSAFVDPTRKEKTDTGFDINAPKFDADKMTKELPEMQVSGSGQKELKEAMLTLYKNPQGDDLQKALQVVATSRGMTLAQAQAQYQKAMEVRAKGRARAEAQAKLKGEKYEDVSPDLDLKKHGDFTGSLSQLRFGSILGDVFGLDPVFGALISPTGGLVGPGNKSVQLSDNNPVALHGTVHDAAGYLLNAHGTGPGYNYLKKSWELDTTNCLSGQVSGIAHWTKAEAVRLVKKVWNKIKNFASRVWQGAKNIAVKAWEGTKVIATKIAQKTKAIVSKVWEGTKNIASKIANTTKKVVSKAYEGAKWAINKTVEGAKKGINTVWEGAKSVATTTKNVAVSTWNGITNTAQSVVEGTKNAASNAWEGTKNVASSTWNKISSWF